MALTLRSGWSGWNNIKLQTKMYHPVDHWIQPNVLQQSLVQRYTTRD